MPDQSTKNPSFQNARAVLAKWRPAPKPPSQNFLASLASLAENKFKLPSYSGLTGRVVSINETTNPAIFSVFCVLSG
jgi:hypothetical protein